MKRISALSVIIFSAVINMEEKSAVEFSFSSEENEYYEWFEEQKERYTPNVWLDLSTKAKKALHGDSTEDELKEGAEEFVGFVFTKLNRHAVTVPYEQDSIVSTLCKMRIAMRSKDVIIKPTGKTTARMYAFTHLLTPEEKATVQEENFLKYPEAADDAMKHYGQLLTNELVKLGLVEDTIEARESSAQYWHKKKMAELSSSYKK